jgi:iron only hydrogenase large subunit-like protein
MFFHLDLQLDRNLRIRRSHENPTIKALYERHLGEPGGEKAHELLHIKQVYGGDEGKKDDSESGEKSELRP